MVSALKADPKQTSALAQSISGYARSSPGYFADVQARVKKFVEQGQLGIFANGYWGHPAYKLPPEANLMAVAHYLDALVWQREVAKLHTIFGGRNPHPNLLVGGSPAAISVHSPSGNVQTAHFRGGEAATAFVDGFGNKALLVSQTRPEAEITITVKGLVETIDRNGVIGRPAGEPPACEGGAARMAEAWRYREARNAKRSRK